MSARQTPKMMKSHIDNILSERQVWTSSARFVRAKLRPSKICQELDEGKSELRLHRVARTLVELLSSSLKNSYELTLTWEVIRGPSANKKYSKYCDETSEEPQHDVRN